MRLLLLFAAVVGVADAFSSNDDLSTDRHLLFASYPDSEDLKKIPWPTCKQVRGFGVCDIAARCHTFFDKFPELTPSKSRCIKMTPFMHMLRCKAMDTPMEYCDTSLDVKMCNGNTNGDDNQGFTRADGCKLAFHLSEDECPSTCGAASDDEARMAADYNKHLPTYESFMEGACKAATGDEMCDGSKLRSVLGSGAPAGRRTSESTALSSQDMWASMTIPPAGGTGGTTQDQSAQAKTWFDASFKQAEDAAKKQKAATDAELAEAREKMWGDIKDTYVPSVMTIATSDSGAERALALLDITKAASRLAPPPANFAILISASVIGGVINLFNGSPEQKSNEPGVPTLADIKDMMDQALDEALIKKVILFDAPAFRDDIDDKIKYVTDTWVTLNCVGEGEEKTCSNPVAFPWPTQQFGSGFDFGRHIENLKSELCDMQAGNYVFEMDQIFRYVLEMVGDGADAEYDLIDPGEGFYGGPLRTLLPFNDPDGCCSERFVKWSNCGRNTDKEPGYTCMEDMKSANTIVDAAVELLKAYSQMAQGIQLLHATLQAVLNQYGLSSDSYRRGQNMANFESSCDIPKTSARSKLVEELIEAWQKGDTCNNLDQVNLYHGKAAGNMKCNIVRSDLTYNTGSSTAGGYTSGSYINNCDPDEKCTDFGLANRPEPFETQCDEEKNYKNGRCDAAKSSYFKHQVPLGGRTTAFGEHCTGRDNRWKECEELAQDKMPASGRTIADSRDGPTFEDNGYPGPWFLMSGSGSMKYGPKQYNEKYYKIGKAGDYSGGGTKYCTTYSDEYMFWCFRCEYRAPPACQDLVARIKEPSLTE